MEYAADELLENVNSVVIKGGHLNRDKIVFDLVASSRTGERLCIEYPKIHTLNTHGTGCTFSSAIAACLS